jgi:hypothetical protein
MTIGLPLCPRKVLCLILLACSSVPMFADNDSRIRVTADFSEAEAVVAILEKRQGKQDVTAADWQALFATEPYQRLKKREAAMKRTFTDDDFRTFVLSGDLLSQCVALRSTVAAWKQADLKLDAMRILPYLPPESVIRAKVYPVIKPMHNSFVFEADTDPAIFLYVDPSVSRESFANTVAHGAKQCGQTVRGKDCLAAGPEEGGGRMDGCVWRRRGNVSGCRRPRRGWIEAVIEEQKKKFASP